MTPKITPEIKAEIYKLAENPDYSGKDISDIVNAGLMDDEKIKEATVAYHVHKSRKADAVESEESDEPAADASQWVQKELHDAIVSAKDETIKLLNGILDKLLSKGGSHAS
jgi:dGTP triphosphohydrolase